MQCSNLQELPSPPLGKKGWPWTEQSPLITDTQSNGSPWPKVSIVTPSFNQAEYIEETIRSVLLQGYPNLEYIIIDGGSTDESVEIIKRYEKWLTFWVSEPDKGQSHAINKGFENASGQIYAYINSDDFYCPGAFGTVVPIFLQNSGVHLVAGECVIFDEDTIKRIFKPWWPENMDHFLNPFGSTFAQPASFWSRDIHEQVGGFDESFHFCFDREFFLKIGLTGITPHLVTDKLVKYRDHANTKTRQTIRFYEESIPFIEKYAGACGVSEKKKMKLLQQSQNEIDYIQVFIRWKKSGRLAAMKKFISMICRSPALIVERKILGLARRLVCFRAKNVAELSNV
jgi:glycosyltransferase involved in cell wall biosynthesis